MLHQINGLHHVTALASAAAENNAFFTGTLGLRRVKKTVNFDAPDVYHLYYGDAVGTPGTVMTYFPFPDAARGRRGTGEVALTSFAIPVGAATWWAERLAGRGVSGVATDSLFGAARVLLDGPDGERLALVEAADDRAPWSEGGVAADTAIRGFHSVELSLADVGATAELLRFMGYEQTETSGERTRFAVPDGNGASAVDLVAAPNLPPPRKARGRSITSPSPSRTGRASSRCARRCCETGYQVTPPIDRDYFWAIYFRTPGGVLFEVATNEPGFDRDEDRAHLGEALKLPTQHEHLRHRLERRLEPIG